MPTNRILSSVKDRALIEKRRDQMVRGAMKLFKEKGFHRTTTREIAKESGFSIGTLYEYIRTKEDVLFLVVDFIHQQVREQLDIILDLPAPSIENFTAMMRSYFTLMDEMQEEVLILYQEVKSLNKESRELVIQKERDIVHILERVLQACLPQEMGEKDAKLIANNLFVEGQMWAFRRWILQKQFTLEDYIEGQIGYLLNSIGMSRSQLNTYEQRGEA